MDQLQKRIDVLIKLGDWITDFLAKYPKTDEAFAPILKTQSIYNPWLIEPFVLMALKQWADKLTSEFLGTYVHAYPELMQDRIQRHVAVIPQENIPFAGMNDLIAVLLRGHHFYARNVNHSNDLLQYITAKLTAIDPSLANVIHWNVGFKEADTYLLYAKPGNDSVVQSYFANKRSLIKQNRISVAVIANNDGTNEFDKLGEDIFTFFGLSNYSVRKLFVPKTFSFPTFFEAIEKYSWLYQYNRYANNYDYHKSVFLMDLIPVYDNGFVVLRESSELHVPPGCLYYEYYDTVDDVLQRIDSEKLHIQQVVTTLPELASGVMPGMAHGYSLSSYEDNKDTLRFLLD